MAINPCRYDVDELRELAGGRGTTRPGVGETSLWGLRDDRPRFRSEFMVRPDEALLDAQYEAALACDGGNADLPYLSSLPTCYAAVLTVFEWLEYLLARGGESGADDALAYYRSLDWYTDAVESHLRRYLAGLDTPDTHSRSLDTDDHRLSFVYVARLATLVD